MRVVILKTNLKNGLSAVERAVADNANLPVLKNVLLKTGNNKINLSTTNLELAITKTVSGKIIEEGGLTVPLQTFNSIVNNTDQERIGLEKKGNSFIFKTDNYEAKIQGVKEDEFPVIPQLKEDNSLEINSDLFKKAASQVMSAAQISEIRPEISGVLFDYQVSLLKLVATDSFRLAEKTISGDKFKSNLNHAFKAIIPLKTIQEVVRVFDSEQPLTIKFDGSQILFKNKDLEIISKIIDGNYPDYEQIIPKSIETELVLSRDYLNNALKLVSSFSGKGNDVNLAVKDGKILDVYLSNQFLGENNYLIPSKINGPGFDGIAFNWRYLIDGLKAVNSEDIIFGVNDSNKPAIIKSTNDNSYFYILMPIKN